MNVPKASFTKKTVHSCLESAGSVYERASQRCVSASLVGGVRCGRYGQGECGDRGDCESLCDGTAFHDHLLSVHPLLRFREEFILIACLLPPVQAESASESGHVCVIFLCAPEAGYP